MKKMKNIKCLAAIMMVAAMSILNFSCSKDVTPEITIPTGSEDFFKKSMDFESSAAEKKLTFSTNVSWTASVSATRGGVDWLSVTPTSGEPGVNTLAVRANENTTYDDRNAVITITAGDSIRRVFVNQKQLDALTLTADRFEVPAKGDKITIEVKANIAYEMVIPDEYKNWIHASAAATRGLTTTTNTFTIDPSEEYDKREGKIIVKANGKEETVTVYQAGSGILTLTQNEFNINSSAQELTIEISSNFDYTVDLPSVDWIKEITSQTRGLSSHTLRLAIAENTNYDGRSAKIKFYDKNSDVSEEVTINQSQKNALLIEKKAYDFYEKGGALSIDINSNIAYSVSIDCDWITDNQATTRGLEKTTRKFTVAEMTDNTTREGTITFYNEESGISEKVTVKQMRSIYFDTTAFDLMEGGEKTIGITNNTGQSIKWSSSNSSVATVDNNGKVKAISKGTATITAKTADGKYSCTCAVTVKDITAFITVSSLGGSIVSINGVIQQGSKLTWSFANNSTAKVHLNSLQLIDGVTGNEGNIMNVDTDVDANSSVGYTTTIGLLGIHTPVTCRFRYTYNGTEYQADAQYTRSLWW